ncbi:hypothetical protein ACJJTC_003326 [Scirpophaga incertulas]
MTQRLLLTIQACEPSVVAIAITMSPAKLLQGRALQRRAARLDALKPESAAKASNQQRGNRLQPAHYDFSNQVTLCGIVLIVGILSGWLKGKFTAYSHGGSTKQYSHLSYPSIPEPEPAVVAQNPIAEPSVGPSVESNEEPSTVLSDELHSAARGANLTRNVTAAAAGTGSQ